MFLDLDFDQRATVAVLTEIANRSTSAPGDPKETISASPVTHSHFGGTCYYSKFYKRFAWVRPYVTYHGDTAATHQDCLVVSFGYHTPPKEWQNEDHPNHMKHTLAPDIVEAANRIVNFVLDGSLPEQNFPGDYYYREPILKACV
jgi:hypothetical protein